MLEQPFLQKKSVVWYGRERLLTIAQGAVVAAPPLPSVNGAFVLKLILPCFLRPRIHVAVWALLVALPVHALLVDSVPPAERSIARHQDI